MNGIKFLLPAFIFLLMQLVGGILGSVFMRFTPMSDVSSLALAVIVSGILSVIICKILRLTELFRSLVRCSVGFCAAFAGLLAVVACVIATNIFSEQLNLNDLMEDQILKMVHLPMGILAIAIIGPICEEIIFREAILGNMLRRKCQPWTAILCSALAFGVIHLNPAQIPFATIIGIVLGILYYRTGSLSLCCVAHILNNASCVLQMNLLGDTAEDFTLTENLGGTRPALIYGVLTTLLCILLLRYLWYHSSPTINAPKEE